MTAIRVALIAAVARNGVIGDGKGMPWRLSTDLQRFKRLTMGKPVIMGRRTFASIGKALAGRANIVVTRQSGFAAEGVTTATGIEAAIADAVAEAGRAGVDEVMVIGGGEIYAASIGRADRLYITHVEAMPEGATHFPPIDPADWRIVSVERIPAGARDSEATTYVVYDRAAMPAAR